MKRITAIFILLLIAVAHSPAEQLPIRTHTTAEGLPRDQVYKLVTDPHGFLWVCTSDGLSRFDGYEFVNYSVPQGLPHRIVRDLLIPGIDSRSAYRCKGTIVDREYGGWVGACR